ncbi:MAG: LmbE family protein [Verrucomicrobia bacterium]|nr:MAG: LmbE family protein [Verrucomicrobiota bacterium]
MRWVRGQRAAIALFGFVMSQSLLTGTAPPTLPKPMNAAEIQLGLQKLNVLGRVLYVAAHPDDENTNLMAVWSNGSLYDTAYLSLTRGDGGQNLLGPELQERLGVIRTRELLAARQIDHARQFFTRAVDFGFSKSADEALRLWDRDKILSDVVWVIRKFRPDVIVTRFSPEDNLTHGHHTASAILVQEAFKAAADPKRFPEQLAWVKPWQATRLVWNTSPFFFQNRNQPFDPAGLSILEAGGFAPLLGKAFTEIAAASLSMHKSQGVGSPPRRGERKEYFKLLAGPPMTNGLFDGVDTTWKRVPDIDNQVQQLIANFSPVNPAASVPKLLELRKALTAVDNDWAVSKRAEVDGLIASCAALYMESSTALAAVSPGQLLPIKFDAINRSSVAIKLVSVHAPVSGETLRIDAPLARDQFLTKDLGPTLPANMVYSQPYWLRKTPTVGLFTVDDQQLIGLAENPPAFPIEATLDIAGQEIRYLIDTFFRGVDPIAGEVHELLAVAPPVFANLPSGAFVFPDEKARPIAVEITSSTAAVQGSARLDAPAGWQVTPKSVPIDLKEPNEKMFAEFSVTPPGRAGDGTLRAVVSTGGKEFSFSREQIAYPHIGVHILMPAAEARVVRAEIRKTGQQIGYLPGAGDDIPQCLQQIGYSVKVLEPADVMPENLARFDAVVLGIRAYNTQNRIADLQRKLLDYVEAGGVVVAQYNTTADLKTKDIGPYPLEISRDRVTDETAEVRILAPDHPVLTRPNKITAEDFKGWVQERGLYFPNKWDPRWTAILSSNDPGEKPMDGGLLVAKAGKGYFVYTGYSWFRQLPAGVPGAYRLFANLVSLRSAE